MKYVVMERWSNWAGTRPVSVCGSPDEATQLVGKIVAKRSMDSNYSDPPPAVYFVPVPDVHEDA